MGCSKEGKRSKKYLNKSDRKTVDKPLIEASCKAAFRIGLINLRVIIISQLQKLPNIK